MKISIPKLGKLPGYPSYPEESIFKPMLQLNENRRQGHHDTVFTAQLIHAARPEKILDLGCYTGMLAAFVEDLLQHAHSDHAGKSSWSLVDNFDFLRDLKTGLNDPDHRCFDLNENILKPLWREAMNSKFYINQPPVTADELGEFVRGVVQSHDGPMPLIQDVKSSIDAVSGTYDFVIYDLYGSNYTFDWANHVVCNLMRENAIIVFDDIKPRWPQQMAMFVKIVNTLPVIPVAFNSAKVAMIKTSPENKASMMNQLRSRLHIGGLPEIYSWTVYTNEVFGQTLSLKDHI